MTIVLERFDDIDNAHDRSGFGALQSTFGNLPLKQLGYRTRVATLSVRTTICQTYYNPFDQAIEATYIFPIEGQQAVVACEIQIGDRVVRAELKERSQAREDYRRAIQSGHRAALLEENRSETFSMRVGNIPPGEAIQVRIETVGQLSVAHGEWTLRLPLVVAPRYTSGLALPRSSVASGITHDTDQVPDASSVTPPTWLPGFASPVDLQLSVDLHLGQLATEGWIQHLKSSLHSIVLEPNNAPHPNDSASSCRIKLLPGERVDRDFILRGKIDDTAIRTALTVEGPSQLATVSDAALPAHSTFALNIVPPRAQSRVARDIVFLLDRSGSMDGWKMAAARRGISRLIDSLQSTDRFQAIAFDDQLESFCGASGKLRADSTWQSATDSNRYEATRWLSRIESRGGTEMGLAIERGLQAYATGESGLGRNAAIVLVTDGQVTGEDSILRLIGSIPERSRPRLFCLGIDRAVNMSVLQRIAKLTGGTCELVESEKRLDEILRRFADEIGSPVVSGLRVTANTAILNTAPSNATTLYTGRALTIYGQVAEAGDSLMLTLSGFLPSGEAWSVQVKPELGNAPNYESAASKILLPLWGKSRIRELEDAMVASGNHDTELARTIVDCSLACNVLSRLTAFVAVDETEKVTLGQAVHRIHQPNEYPEGWKSITPTLDSTFLIPLPSALGSPASSGSSAKLATEVSKQVAQCLLHGGKISSEQFSEAELLSQAKGLSVADALIQLGYVNGEAVGRATAEVSRLPYIDPRNLQIDEQVIQSIPESVARENGVLPIAKSGNTLTVLVSDPSDLDTIEKLRFILNCNVVSMVSAADAIAAAINDYYGQVEGESADSLLQEFTDTQIDFMQIDSMEIDFTETQVLGSYCMRGVGYSSNIEDESIYPSPSFGSEPEELIVTMTPFDFDPPQIESKICLPISPDLLGFSEAPVVRLVNLILQEAVQLRASHIFLIAKEDHFTVTYLIDGALVERDSPPLHLLAATITRLKILAKLDIAERDSFQTGTIALPFEVGDAICTFHCIGEEVLLQMPAAAGLKDTPVVVREWLHQRQRV